MTSTTDIISAAMPTPTTHEEIETPSISCDDTNDESGVVDISEHMRLVRLDNALIKHVLSDQFSGGKVPLSFVLSLAELMHATASTGELGNAFMPAAIGMYGVPEHEFTVPLEAGWFGKMLNCHSVDRTFHMSAQMAVCTLGAAGLLFYHTSASLSATLHDLVSKSGLGIPPRLLEARMFAGLLRDAISFLETADARKSCAQTIHAVALSVRLAAMWACMPPHAVLLCIRRVLDFQNNDMVHQAPLSEVTFLDTAYLQDMIGLCSGSSDCDNYHEHFFDEVDALANERLSKDDSIVDVIYRTHYAQDSSTRDPEAEKFLNSTAPVLEAAMMTSSKLPPGDILSFLISVRWSPVFCTGVRRSSTELASLLQGVPAKLSNSITHQILTGFLPSMQLSSFRFSTESGLTSDLFYKGYIVLGEQTGSDALPGSSASIVRMRTRLMQRWLRRFGLDGQTKYSAAVTSAFCQSVLSWVTRDVVFPGLSDDEKEKVKVEPKATYANTIKGVEIVVTDSRGPTACTYRICVSPRSKYVVNETKSTEAVDRNAYIDWIMATNLPAFGEENDALTQLLPEGIHNILIACATHLEFAVWWYSHKRRELAMSNDEATAVADSVTGTSPKMEDMEKWFEFHACLHNIDPAVYVMPVMSYMVQDFGAKMLPTETSVNLVCKIMKDLGWNQDVADLPLNADVVGFRGHPAAGKYAGMSFIFGGSKHVVRADKAIGSKCRINVFPGAGAVELEVPWRECGFSSTDSEDMDTPFFQRIINDANLLQYMLNSTRVQRREPRFFFSGALDTGMQGNVRPSPYLWVVQ